MNYKPNILISVCGEKPNYEVGSSAKLSFAKKPEKASAAIWKLDADDDEEVFDISEHLKNLPTPLS